MPLLRAQESHTPQKANLILISKCDRAHVFFQATAAGLTATVVAVPLAWYLMKRTLWTPMLLGLAFVMLGTFLITLLPETLSLPKILHAVPEDPIAPEDADTDQDLSDSSDRNSSSSTKKGFLTILEKLEDARFVFASPMLCTLAFVFLVQTLGGNSVPLLLQLASKRFHWSLADVGGTPPIDLS
jgi:hypothetical protein